MVRGVDGTRDLVPIKSANDGRVAADAASRKSVVQSTCSINWLLMQITEKSLTYAAIKLKRSDCLEHGVIDDSLVPALTGSQCKTTRTRGLSKGTGTVKASALLGMSGPWAVKLIT